MTAFSVLIKKGEPLVAVLRLSILEAILKRKLDAEQARRVTFSIVAMLSQGAPTVWIRQELAHTDLEPADADSLAEEMADQWRRMTA